MKKRLQFWMPERGESQDDAHEWDTDKHWNVARAAEDFATHFHNQGGYEAAWPIEIHVADFRGKQDGCGTCRPQSDGLFRRRGTMTDKPIIRCGSCYQVKYEEPGGMCQKCGVDICEECIDMYCFECEAED